MGKCTPLAGPQFRAPQFRGGGTAGGVSRLLSRILPRSASPQAHLREALRNAEGNRTSPERHPLAQETPRSPTWQQSLPPPATILPPRALAGTPAAREGFLPRGTRSLRLRAGRPAPPVVGKKKKKARARAGWLEGREPRGARAQAPRTRAHACPCLADVAPRAQEFPGSPDFFRVLDPEWRGSGSPQGQGGESRPAGTPE